MKKNFFDPSTTRGSLAISVVICGVIGVIAALSSAIEEGENLIAAPLYGMIGGACMGVVVFVIFVTISTFSTKKNRKSFLNVILNRYQDTDE